MPHYVSRQTMDSVKAVLIPRIQGTVENTGIQLALDPEKAPASEQVQPAGGVAVIPVHGLLVARRGQITQACTELTSYERIRSQLNAALNDPSISEIVLDINSGGGAAVGCKELADYIYQSRETKPITAIVNYSAYSGEIYFDDVFFVDVTDSLTTEGNATAINSLTTRVTNAEGKITANTTAISNMTSRVGNAESAIDGLNETTAANGLAMANGFQQMRAQVGDVQASITTTSKALADLEKSTTEQVTTLTSRVGDMSATVQQTASTVADLNGKLGAQWGVKVNTSNGGTNYVAGIQLGINGSGQSQFLVQADTFGVYVPNGDKNNLVFGTDGNGAYMQQAMARNLVIDFAQITNNIQSTNYVVGSRGWAINKNGGAQFNDAIFRGHIEAQSGYFAGTVYANRIEGDVGAFAINVAQHRTRGVPKAQWVWFDLLRIRRQGFDQIVNLLGGLLQNDRISVSGGGTLRAGMSYAPGSDGGLDPGYLSYAILMRATGATSGGGAMTVALSLDGNILNQWDSSVNLDNYSFIVPAGTGDAVLRYGGYLDRNGSMVITILSRFSAFVARNSNAISGAQSA